MKRISMKYGQVLFELGIKKESLQKAQDMLHENEDVYKRQALNQAIECSKPFAMVTLLGNPHRDTTIKLDQHSMILRTELRFTGVWNNYYSDLPFNEWKYTVDMLNEGKLEVLDLITHRSDLDRCV